MFVVHCDASDAGDSRQLARWLHNHLPAVQVFGHAAGLVGMELVPDLTPEQFSALALPKVRVG